ncbi:MAG: PAS domain S-box protein [Verrucomicrobiales bacterium]|nr:PAS domain S-box protein [Verrucomicrobiales bacterium]
METSTPIPDWFEPDQNILDSIPLLIVFKDKENNILRVNRTAALAIGAEATALINRPLSDILPNDADYLHKNDLKVIESGESILGSIESVTAGDGKKLWLRIDRIPRKDEEGNVTGIVIFAADITGQHRAEARLRNSEALLRRAEKIGRLGAWEWNVATDRIRWSDEMFRVLGLEREGGIEPSYTSFEARVHPDDRKHVAAALKRSLKKGHFKPFRFRTVPISGSVRYVQVHGEVILDKDGIVTHLRGIDQDITERKNAEQKLTDTLAELKRSNEALDEFAHAASHDLKAPLRAIDNISHWLEEDLNDLLPDESREHLRMLRQRVARMNKLLTDLLQFSRFGGDRSGAEIVDVEEMLKNMVGQGTFLRPVEMECDNLPVFKTVQISLQRVFHNLIENAAKHHDGDIVKIRIRCTEKQEQYEFSVEDDGPGIPEQYRETVQRMFETLKPRDEVEGSGMGLAFVKKIVENLGGKLSIGEASPRGCIVTFHWPKKV